MKLKDWLKKEGSSFRSRDLNFLIRDVLLQDINTVFIEDTPIDGKLKRRMDLILQQYSSGMPMAYILGKEAFFGLVLTRIPPTSVQII